MKHLASHTPRIVGIETEYGVNPHPDKISQRNLEGTLPGYITAINDSGYLSNGARYYVDQGKNIEYATPECTSPDGILTSHFAGEDLVKRSVTIMYGEEPRSLAYKRTVDNKGKSRGDHENFLTGTEEGPRSVANFLLPHLVTRTIYTGPGMVREMQTGQFRYVIDQRVWSLGDDPVHAASTSDQKPFILDRKEDFAVNADTLRLQVISGSANMFPFPILARMLTTSLVLRLIETGRYPKDLVLYDPMDAAMHARSIAADPDLQGSLVELEGGRTMTAPQLQYELASAACDLADIGELPDSEMDMAYLWREIADDLMSGNIEKWKAHIEWVAKRLYLERKMSRERISLNHPRTLQREIKWHELSDDSVVYKLRELGAIAMMPSAEAVEAAKKSPPDPTRAMKRARVIMENDYRSITQLCWHRWNIRGRRVMATNAYRSS